MTSEKSAYALYLVGYPDDPIRDVHLTGCRFSGVEKDNVFVDSRLLKETPDLPAGSVRLGRPWHPGSDLRVDGSAVFLRCYKAILYVLGPGDGSL